MVSLSCAAAEGGEDFGPDIGNRLHAADQKAACHTAADRRRFATLD
ncbi:hypothetical protein [Streptomyces sp. NPDC090798]